MPDRRPESTEHAPHHAHYIGLVDAPVLAVLERQRDELPRVLGAVADPGFRYAPGKWTVREVVGHCSDAERVYQYRALAFARGDAITAPKYDPDGYVAHAGFDARSMESLVAELLAVRTATLEFFRNLPAEAWSRAGTMGAHPLSVRALAFIAAGHVRRHLDVLRDRYRIHT